MWSMRWIYVDYMSDLYMLNRCWVCVELLWIICRIYVDYMSNRCWIDVEYIQSRVEANQWTLGLCLSHKVTPVGGASTRWPTVVGWRVRLPEGLVSPCLPSSLHTCVGWCAGLPEALSPIVSLHVCLCWMVRPFPRSCLPLSPIVSPQVCLCSMVQV